METPISDSKTPKNPTGTVRDFFSRPFRVDADLGHSGEVKLEWVEEPQAEAYVLLNAAEARQLAAKLRHAIQLPIGRFFRESVFDVRGVAELSVGALIHSGVYLSLVDGYATGTFKQLGQFLEDEVQQLVTALEGAASVVERA